MLRALLLAALLATTAAADSVTGYVRYQGWTYAVVESKITKPPKVNNDFYGKARAGYAAKMYGPAKGKVQGRSITRTTLEPVSEL